MRYHTREHIRQEIGASESKSESKRLDRYLLKMEALEIHVVSSTSRCGVELYAEFLAAYYDRKLQWPTSPQMYSSALRRGLSALWVRM